MAQRKQECILFERISGSSWNGPGRELHGSTGEGPYSKMATGQKDPDERPGPYLRGPADDITPHHYGVRGIYRIFGDAVYVMIPATAIYIRK